MESASKKLPTSTVLIDNDETQLQVVFTVALAVLVAFTLITPHDTLGIKKAALLFALITTMPTWLEGLIKDAKQAIPLVILPVTMCCISTVITKSLSDSVIYLYPFAYLLLVFPIERWHIDVRKMVVIVGHIMATCIVLSAVLDSLEVVAIKDNLILSWLDAHQEASISTSSSAAFRYVIFFKASPIMLFAIAEDIRNKRVAWTVITYVALLFSGTRANIALGTLVAVVLIVYSIKHKSFRFLVIACLIGIAFVFGAEIVSRYQTLNAAKVGGDGIRIGTLYSFLDAMNSEPHRWLTGMGFGSSYFSYGRNALVVTSELSYLEFIRETGIIFGTIVILLIIAPALVLTKSDLYLAVPYISYLICGIFEPFVFTSTGFLVLLVAYAAMREHQMRVGSRTVIWPHRNINLIG